MTYAYVQDVAASWVQYERMTAGLIEPPPAGLLVHLAGPTDDGVRIIGVWESEEEWERFRSEHLVPALAALRGPSRPAQTFRDVRPAHVVIGSPADWRRPDEQEEER